MAGLPQEPMDSAISIAVFMAGLPQEPMDSAISIAGYLMCVVYNFTAKWVRIGFSP
jgi:hypothetical protein